MAKIIKKGNKNFTITSNKAIRDSRLTWEARGVFNYLWSQADEWTYRAKEVATHSPQGIDKLNKCLKELEKYGYLERKRSREGGMLKESIWTLTDSPKLDLPIQVKPKQVKPILAKPKQANPRLRNTNSKKQQVKETTSKRNSSSANAEPSSIHQNVIDYLNGKIGARYKASSAINKRLIDARVKEGYTLDDFKRVIDNKVASWSQDQKMSKYLRPQTLFGTKFESYLNERAPNVPVHADFGAEAYATGAIEGVEDDDLSF